MKRALIALAALNAALAIASTDSEVAEAASRFAPKVSWNSASVIRLDFTCRGRTEYAILGATKAEEALVEGRPVGQTAPELVVAVFVAGIKLPPMLLQDSSRTPEFATLSIESLDFNVKNIDGMAGGVPEGLRKSRTCKGLRLSDDQIDSLHLYWNRARGQISAWSL